MKSKIYKKPQAKSHGMSKNEFLNWDDNLYVTENADITELKADNVNAFFTKKYFSNYLPLTICGINKF